MQDGKFLLKKGKEAHDCELWTEAIDLLEQASQISPNEFVWFYLGSSYSSTGEHQKAIELYDKAYDILSKEENVYNTIIVLLSKVKEYQKLYQFKDARDTIEIAKKVAKKISENSDNNNRKQEEFKIALAETKTKEMEIKKHYSDLDNEAKNLEKRMSYKEAIEHFTLMMQEFPEPEIFYRRGKCYQELSRFEEAIKDYINCQKNKSRIENYCPVESMYNQGICLQEMGRLQDAVEILKDALKEIIYYENQVLQEKISAAIKQIVRRIKLIKEEREKHPKEDIRKIEEIMKEKEEAKKILLNIQEHEVSYFDCYFIER